MNNRFGGRLPLQRFIQTALAEDGQAKLAEAGARRERQAPEGRPVWLHDPVEVEKVAAALDVVAINLGSIVDDRSPMERLAETASIRSALSKLAEGPQPPMKIGDDTSTFPVAMGVGVPTDLHSPPGGTGVQPYKLDKALPKLSPPMTIGVQSDVKQPNIGEAVPTDEQPGDAPGGAKANPLFGGPPTGPKLQTSSSMGKTSAAKGRYVRMLLKLAQDPSSPQPDIAGKVSGDPQQAALGYFASASEDGVPWGDVGDDPSNKQRSVLQNNTAPVDAKPRDLSVVSQRPDMAKLLSEPMQSAAHDSKLKENLPQIEAAAGPKLASVQPRSSMAKTAAARALLKKLAEAGAQTGQGPENKTGTASDEESKSKEEHARMLASRAGQKAQEKKAQGLGGLGSSPAPSSPTPPMMAGPGIASGTGSL